MKAKLKSLSSRRHVQSVIPALCKIREYMRGWLNYYGIAAMKLGIPKYYAHMAANSRRGHWFISATSTVNRALSKEILVRKGFYDLADAYQQMHVNY